MVLFSGFLEPGNVVSCPVGVSGCGVPIGESLGQGLGAPLRVLGLGFPLGGLWVWVPIGWSLGKGLGGPPRPPGPRGPPRPQGLGFPSGVSGENYHPS